MGDPVGLGLKLAGKASDLHTAATTKKWLPRKLMKIRKFKWCGEGDLNPHEIAPASTSS